MKNTNQPTTLADMIEGNGAESYWYYGKEYVQIDAMPGVGYAHVAFHVYAKDGSFLGGTIGAYYGTATPEEVPAMDMVRAAHNMRLEFGYN